MNPLFRKTALIAASLGLLVSLFIALSPATTKTADRRDDGRADDERAPARTTTAATTTETAPTPTARRCQHRHDPVTIRGGRRSVGSAHYGPAEPGASVRRRSDSPTTSTCTATT